MSDAMNDDEIRKLEEIASSTSSVALAVIATNLSYARRDIMDVRNKLDENYASKAYVDGMGKDHERRLGQLEKVVYGASAFILLAVLGTILAVIGLHK